MATRIEIILLTTLKYLLKFFEWFTERLDYFIEMKEYEIYARKDYPKEWFEEE